MPRYAPAMSTDDFRLKLVQYAILNDYEENYGELNQENPDYERLIYFIMGEELEPKIWDDWAKVDFDNENMMLSNKEFYLTSTGVPYALLYVGGDWETPVACIIYHDGKNYRGYVPKDGNSYNYKTKTAFGNGDEDEDNAQCQLQFPGQDAYDVEPDLARVQADIDKRIVARGTATVSKDLVIPKAVERKKAQKALEVNLPADGYIRSEHVYADISLCANGSYFTFQSRESGRTLNNDELERIIGIPPIFKKRVVGDDLLWYSADGCYPQTTLKLLEYAGFEKAPNCVIHEGITRIITLI